MPLEEFDDLRLFITGPTYVRPEVRRAGALPEFGHRDSENAKRMGPIQTHLRALAGAGEEWLPMLLGGSGTTAMEAAIRSLSAPGENVLNVVVGAFGELYHTITRACGRKAAALRFAPGQPVDLEVLEASLAEHRPDVVTLTHNETSTGVISDVAAACGVAREHGVLPLVDGVSLLGGAPVDLESMGAACYCSSTQKSLALPAGFGIAFVSDEALDKAGRVADKGYVTDFARHAAKARAGQTLTTPNTTLLNQMAVQLTYIMEEEGMENRFARHKRMRSMVEEFADSLDGFDMLAAPGSRSPTLSCLRAPRGAGVADLKALKETMRAKGYLFDPGYSKLNVALEESGERVCFRIGHMGDMTEDMLSAYLDDLRGPLCELAEIAGENA
ncbi:pyridoxal-phosphate-dependent aminotransferase family protein [Desulfohalovibrio reitneri]|uniref:pyridoxal-phosphate-dependent aminotransferase family protein n=1 Tax=Desulfohalovibrio reitneri TaxID=1307759 RepID=UPI0004A74163|nr:aminotransferase class V-fold PLP-dependent enzyme [Desulfohalovibrio reitneri]